MGSFYTMFTHNVRRILKLKIKLWKDKQNWILAANACTNGSLRVSATPQLTPPHFRNDILKVILSFFFLSSTADGHDIKEPASQVHQLTQGLPQVLLISLQKKNSHVKSNHCNRRQRRDRFRACPTSRWERPHSLPRCKEWECWKTSSVRI